MKTTTAQRVVVLGREGQARTQLVSALTELGVTPVWVGKPAQTNPDSLSVLHPNKIIVSLDPAIEIELEPFTEFLSDPTRQVLYDEAEITKNLSGWDLNRWARNMAAKMLDRDPMPTVATGKQAEPVAEPQLRPDWQSHHFDFSDDTTVNKINQNDLSLETTGSEVNRWVDNSEYELLEIDEQALNAALQQLNNNLADGFNPDDIMEISFEQQPPSASAVPAQSSALSSATPELAMDVSLEAIDVALKNEETPIRNMPNRLEQSDLQNFIDEAQSSASELHADDSVPLEPAQIDPVLAWSLELGEPEEVDTSALVQPPEASFDISKFSLLDEIPKGSDFSTIHDPVVYREEVVDNGSSYGMILAISGLGGPAAVRALVELVPEKFEGVMVSAHHFNAGQLLPLRDQLQKISKVPVCVAEPEEYLKSGRVYLFPQGLVLYSTSLGYQCTSGKWNAYIDQMDPNAQVVILSGADVTLSQSLIQVSALSNAIHIQDPEHCFDATLVQQLKNVGASIINPDVVALWFT
jgi:chemosensory pili system protein ChpB (putative protein-glutamate methylesterase)